LGHFIQVGIRQPGKKLRIVHINKHDAIGGAARAAHRLHTGLLRSGQSSSMFVFRKSGLDPKVSQFVPPNGLNHRLYRVLRNQAINLESRGATRQAIQGYEKFSSDRTRFGKQALDQIPSADVINLHWVSDFIDLEIFFSGLGEEKRIVWTLHDMNTFTGGCHYDMGCNRYRDQCGACPQLLSANPVDASRRIWNRKKQLFSSLPKHQLHFVALNKWMRSEIENSPLLNRFPVSLIPNGLDLEVFKPRNREVARDILKIERDANVLLFVADTVSYKRKGFSLLDESLKKIKHEENLVLVSVGRDRPTLHAGHRHIHLDAVDDDEMLSQIYGAADIFVIPSLQDNLPNTVMEAIACGVPVVGFDAGGIPDMVRPGETGLLATGGNVDELTDSILALLGAPEKRKKMAENCRRVAVAEYGINSQADSYLEVYQRLLNQAG